jgi:hypothetical protein
MLCRARSKGRVPERKQALNNAIQWSDLATIITVAGLVGAGIWRAATMIGGLRQELTQYKLEVAEKYVSAQSMRDLEERLIKSIERLGDRLDRAFEKHGG